ncbi:MAG: hypothetical protein ACI9G9_001475 [Psychromonas sp.]|jgi:hypothetical protein
MKLKLLAILTIISLLISCGVQKRHAKGIKFSKVAFHKADKSVSAESEDFQISSNDQISYEINGIDSRPLNRRPNHNQQDYADLNSDFTDFEKSESKPLLTTSSNTNQRTAASPNDSCDEIIMRNGEIIMGKVIELSQLELKYKRCRNLDGPNIVINKNDVLLIRYSNGETDTFASRKTAEPEEETTEELEQKVNAQSNASLILGLISGSAVFAGLIWLIYDEFITAIIGFSVFPVALLATIFGGLALKWKLKKEPRTKRNKKARAGLVLGIIGLAGVLATALIVIIGG